MIEGELIQVANDDGVTSVKVTDPDTVNLVWAKLYGSDERVVQAYNGRVQPRNLLPVWLRQLADGTYEIEGVRSRDGSDFAGEGLGSLNIPQLIGELLDTVWPARNLKPGRVRLSALGGMNVYVEAFYFHTGRFAGGNLDLTAYIPSTSNRQVWACIWYDPTLDVLGVTTGTEYTLAYTMLEDDLGAIAINPQYIPLAGVILTQGDTAVSASTVFIARQPWFSAAVANDSFFPIAVTDARVIPTNRQLVISQVSIGTGGSITVNGILQIVG